jgi:diaminopimelate decarboxylase
MSTLGQTAVTANIILSAIENFGSPLYLYDAKAIVEKCSQVKKMPHAFGLTVRYAIKANSSRVLLQLVEQQGLEFDVSTLNEARRAHYAGIPFSKMMLTTQEVPLEKNRTDLESMILAGLKYNVCSLRQLNLITDFAIQNNIKLSMRVHPGSGTGESATRNTGDEYSSFGVHLSNVEEAMSIADNRGLVFNQVHVHIGSGGNPKVWRENVDRELGFVERYFPNADIINFGGGFKEARMPHETAANIQELGKYAKNRVEEFYKKTNRKLYVTIEPGTFIVANAGFLVTTVLDKKSTGPNGFDFVILNAGMDANTRPLLYGSEHPFYVISKNGQLLSSEGDENSTKPQVVVGRCCESGDAQCLDASGKAYSRKMADPDFDDYVVIGGTGAYCSSMSPFNYNSSQQLPEVVLNTNGELQLVRKRQELEDVFRNEIDF